MSLRADVSRKTNSPSAINTPQLATILLMIFFFFQAEDGIRDVAVTGVQTCALPIFIVSAAAVVLLRRGIYAPFGYTLRAARDSAVRADAIGIDVRTHRWLAFTIAEIGRASCRERV